MELRSPPTLLFVTLLLTQAAGGLCRSLSAELPEDGVDLPRDARPEDPPAWRDVMRVEGEVLVKFRPGASLAAKQHALARGQATAAKVLHTAADGSQLLRVRLPASADFSTAAIAARMQLSAPAVEYVEPNYLVHPAQIVYKSNDSMYASGSLWGMYGAATDPRNIFGSHAASAWGQGVAGSEDIYVGVVDQGIMFNHVDLAANIQRVDWESTTDGVDNDGNGYADDARGWNFLDKRKGVYTPGFDRHGTHVAGIIGAVGNNGLGVVGAAPKVHLLSGKFMNTSSGTVADAILAIDYFTDLKTRHGLKLVATCNSWGGSGYSQFLYEAIQRANQAGILFVTSAGNQGRDLDTKPLYPAAYPLPNVITVAAINKYGQLAGFSNYGAKSVHLAAPGTQICSTLPSTNGLSSSYGCWDGTSMAAPHVVGAAVLYASKYPTATAAQIRSAILLSAYKTLTPSLAGKIQTGGRLNVTAMLLMSPGRKRGQKAS